MNNCRLIKEVKAMNLDAIKSLIANGANVNQQDEHGWTPINWAAAKGSMEIVTCLVENGADISKTGRDQRTPFMISLAAGHFEVAKFLKEIEKNMNQGKTQINPEHKYCKAYHLWEVSKFTGWYENNFDENTQEKGKKVKNAVGKCSKLTGNDIVFLHYDFTVTRSIWHNDSVIFNDITEEWKQFCKEVLGFRIPEM